MSLPRVAWLVTLLVGTLAIQACGTPPAPERAPDATPASVDEFRAAAEKVLQETGVPGAGLALVRAEGVEWAGGVGLADRDTGAPVTADTHFRVGSISKTFVAMALVQQYEDDAMDIEAPVSELAPQVAIDNRWNASSPVTVLQLLQHTAGFDDMHFTETYNLHDPPDMPLRSPAEESGIATRAMAAGTRMSYSNPGYGVAAYVLEQVTGRAYEEIISERIFKPLGMHTSSFVLRDADLSLMAKGYDAPTGPPVPYSQIYLRPAGNLHTSAAELATFVQMLLNWGEISGRSSSIPST
jgi:CubicO group peptidase (beta-lactamase class C family)